RFNNEIVMLFRSHLRSGISVLGLARSKNGLTSWQISKEPALMPCHENDLFGEGKDKHRLIENEAGGVEDPRISLINNTYHITYSAYHALVRDRVRVSLATTTDFVTYTRYGEVMDMDMRNVALFPEKIKGKFVALMRPNDDSSSGHTGGTFKEIKIAYSDDLRNNVWHINPEPVMKQGGGPGAFSDKIGPGAPPIKSKLGWMQIFHGVRSTMDGNPYVLGVAFHDFNDPEKVIVSSIPILFPSQADYRVQEDDYIHVPQVVFTCGAIRNNDGTILIYYGGNDTVMNVALSHEDVLYALCEKYPQEPLTGQPLYKL
ncbi:MAG: hypothetical protein KAG99_03295, partial [Bacteroidales bacterium]|nr:hypothetical protein [Bacteroidales bacterium]